jgi:cellulose synthase/poly-beta-1,6-N-acetylglucosamine synthase-like glycosyltransferase
LTVGITHSSGKLIVTTDADCIVPENWLRNFAFEFEIKNPVMIVAPVIFSSSNEPFSIFQSLDFMTMQGITIATHQLGWGSMSNGANLAFTKKVFEEVKGYEGISHLASGDDLMLTSKMNKQFPKKIVCLKSENTIVTTQPQPDLRNFLRQRIRWASKSGKYNDKRLTATLCLVYLFNLSLVLLTITCLKERSCFYFLLLALILKTISELFFLIPVARFFKQQKCLRWFPFLQPFHVLYIVCAGFFGMIGKYQWKGRSIR